MCEGASKQSSDLKNYTAPGPRPPVFKFLDPPLYNAYNMYLYSLLLLQKHRVCVKGHQNKSQTLEYYRTGTAPPGFEIPGSATAVSIKEYIWI